MPKKKQIELSLKQAQMLALTSQGLASSKFGKGKKAVLNTIEHLGYVQIDTLSVVARAHHHTLWSRIPDYQETMLHALQVKDKSIFEYWSHAASYLPMKDYRYSLFTKQAYANGRSHWFPQDKKLKKYVLERIAAEGALQSKDFEHKRSGPGNWYEWKPAKQALEQLFMEGKLMVANRQCFQKVYDLPERVLPPDIDNRIPTAIEYASHLIQAAIRANGVVEEKEIAYIRKGLKEPIAQALKQLLLDGTIVEVRIEGQEKVYLTDAKQLFKIETAINNNQVHLLSPFDNTVIQRKRLQRLFDFDYQIECYLPEAKRRFGYFCLPILFGDKFVARFDPKADRAQKTFYIKSMHFELGYKQSEEFNHLFAEKLKVFAAFNGCNKIVIDNADRVWKKKIIALL